MAERDVSETAQGVPGGVGGVGAGRSPMMELLVIAVPTVATMTSYTLMTFFDKLMCSRIGPDPVYVGAQGNGGLSSWVLISVVYGTLMIVNTFVSQNLGAGKPERGAGYAWNAMWMSVVAFVVMMVPYGFAIPHLYALMRDASMPAEELAGVLRRDEMASEFARILIFGSLFTIASRALSQYFYGMHKPLVVLVASVSGNLVNVFCNSVLIYGPERPVGWDGPVLEAWFGMTSGIAAAAGIPKMEIAGAAWGTVIATFVELAIMFAIFFAPKINRLSWKPNVALMKDILRLGWPAGLMFGNEMVCWGMFMVYFVGHFGPDHSTAGWIAHQWMSLSFMPAVGISVAVTAVVGKCMGMGRPDLAEKRAKLGLALAMGYMGLCAVLFVVLRGPLVGLFIDANTPPERVEVLMALGGKFLILTAVFQLFDAIAMTLSGALRGAGDTIFVGIVTVISSWVVIVGGGWVTVTYFPAWESTGPWVAAAAYIICLSVFVLGRFLSGKWKAIKLVDKERGDPQAASSLVTDGVM